MIRRTWNGEAAKAARTSTDLKPDEVAEKLAVDRSSVYGWEAGREPSMRHVLALAALYRVTIESLFHDQDATEPPNGRKQAEKTPAATASPAKESAAAAR